MFVARPPRPPFDRFVASVWACDLPPRTHALERVLPTGAAQLIVNLRDDETRAYDAFTGTLTSTAPGSILAGVHTRAQVIDTAEQQQVAGIAFHPGGLAPFFRDPASTVRDLDVPLEALWGVRRTSLLREQLLAARDVDARLDVLEAALDDVWCGDRLPHPSVVHALQAFRRASFAGGITRVADASGLSTKRFIEHFTRAVGVTPKRYCRLRRFQRAVAHANRGVPVSWSGVALDCGYFDQAHFVNDFRDFAGVTPSAYLAGRTEFQNHVKFFQDHGTAG